jgi:HAE1 family hydrophobic/amphiphilic exporter-1
VALRNLVDTERGTGPVTVERKDQQRLVTVTANVAGRDLGSVAADVQTRLETIPRPIGYDLLVSGNFEEQQKAFDELMVSLALALALVYRVLASQYESLRDPLVVMVSVPLAAIGVILTLFLTETTMNLQSGIGCIMLGGIVVNNAILLVDQAGRLRRDGLDTHADAQAPLARAVVGGLSASTLITLVLVPVVYSLFYGKSATRDTASPSGHARV